MVGAVILSGCSDAAKSWSSSGSEDRKVVGTSSNRTEAEDGALKSCLLGGGATGPRGSSKSKPIGLDGALCGLATGAGVGSKALNGSKLAVGGPNEGFGCGAGLVGFDGAWLGAANGSNVVEVTCDLGGAGLEGGGVESSKPMSSSGIVGFAETTG